MAQRQREDLSARVLRMQSRYAPPLQAPDHTEPAPVSAPEPQNRSVGDSELIRWNRWQSGKYSRIQIDGLARVAWARHRAGISTDKLDRYAMERVSEEDAKWQP